MQDEHDAPFKWNIFFLLFIWLQLKAIKKKKNSTVKEWNQVLVHVKMSNTLTPARGTSSSLYTEANELPRME